MTQYKIERWDAVLYGNNIIKSPIIYIKPDKYLLEFAKANNYLMVVKIEGTNTIYDGREILGVLDLSAVVPNQRPNFFEDTGLYVIKLYAHWYGYPSPSKLGMVSFLGYNSIDYNEEKNETNNEINNIKKENFIGSKNKKGNFYAVIAGVTIGILILIYVNYFFKLKLEKLIRKFPFITGFIIVIFAILIFKYAIYSFQPEPIKN